MICEREGELLKIWTVVNQATPEQRYAVYEEQLPILQLFRDADIDFQLVDRYDRPLDQVAEWSEQALLIEG